MLPLSLPKCSRPKEAVWPRDPEELRPLIDAWRRYATTVVVRHEGTLAESRLREVLAFFGYPVAQEHAAERALHAALALAEHLPVGETALPAGLAVRVGVASGLVIADPDGEVLGETPVEAARLQDLPSWARSSSPEITRRVVGDLFAYRDLGRLIVRGVGPVPAWQVLGRSALGSRSEARSTPPRCTACWSRGGVAHAATGLAAGEIRRRQAGAGIR